jgi:hypothetical protein
LAVDVARDHEGEQGIDGNSPGGFRPRKPRLDREMECAARCAFRSRVSCRRGVFVRAFGEVNKSQDKRRIQMVGRIYKSILVFTLAFSALLMAQTPPDNPLAPYIPKNMKPYYLDILVTKDSPEASIPDAGRMAWMQKHLAYIRSQAEAGKFVLVGPVTEDPTGGPFLDSL